MSSTNIYHPPESARFYGPAGPVLSVPRADGKGDRSPTVTDARKLGLGPSVTTILGVMRKPALEHWIINQNIMAALTLPRRTGEALDDFARRVVEDAKLEAEKASDFGTAMHQWIRFFLLGGDLPPHDDPLFPYAAGFKAWWCAHEWSTYPRGREGGEDALYETPFFCEYGEGFRFGGTADYTRPDIMIDWKTQKQGRKKGGGVYPLRPYPQWGSQLAAYSYGLGGDSVMDPTARKLYSVIISSTVPGNIKVVEWEPKQAYLDAFFDCLALYYGPLGPGHKLRG